MKKILSKKENISNLPKTPGVYQFIDKQSEVLYVGKAKNLKSRIKSYFAKEINRGAGIFAMVEKAKYIKFIECESEIEAVVLEAELIKKLRPKYNIRQKDDKSFALIEISKEDYPKVIISRFKDFEDQKSRSDYFGPYPSGDSLKKSLRYLRKIFPHMDCSKSKYNSYKKKNRPCLYGEIEICTAPCVNLIKKNEYRKNINYLKTFLRGGKKQVVTKLEKEMKVYSKKKKYEKASTVKKKLEALYHLRDVAVGIRDEMLQSENIIYKRIECYDVSNIGGEYAVGGMSVFVEGKKSLKDYRKFKIKTVKGANDLLMLQEVLKRRIKKIPPAGGWPKPDLILVDGGVNQLKAIQIIVENNKLDIPVASISKGSKRDKNEFHFSDSPTAKYILSTLSMRNILLQARDEAHRFSINYYRTLHKKGMFN